MTRGGRAETTLSSPISKTSPESLTGESPDTPGTGDSGKEKSDAIETGNQLPIRNIVSERIDSDQPRSNKPKKTENFIEKPSLKIKISSKMEPPRTGIVLSFQKSFLAKWNRMKI